MKDVRLLRSELEALWARYDGGAVSPAIYATIKQLEAEIAWLDQREAAQSDTGRATVAKPSSGN